MTKRAIILNDNQITSLYDKAEEIHANVSLLKLFCSEYYDVEDMYKIKPILNYTYRTSDMLYAELIDLRYSETI